MIRSLLLVHLFSFVVGQSPPRQVGNTKQFILLKLNSEFNITCPFIDVEFYTWKKAKSPSIGLSDLQHLQIKVPSILQLEAYTCEAVNGYGRRNAYFIAKGIDSKSKQFDIDCQSRETGPCFLVSEMSNNFDYTVDKGSNVTLDCRAMMDPANQEPPTYSWKKITPPDSFDTKMRNSLTNQRMKSPDELLINVSPDENIEPNSIDDMSTWGAIVALRGVTSSVDGLYQCVTGSSTKTIQRNYRIRVKENKSVSTIEGPLFQSIKASVGSTHVLNCRAFSKPKWGKKLENSEEKLESEEIIKWGGNRYKLLQGSLDYEHKVNGDSVKDSSIYTNDLKLENIQQHHSGIYVCSVLTTSMLEHKFVNLSVEVGSGYTEPSKPNHFPIYIAVPTTIFIICLATIIYCLVHRRIRQKANFKNRVARGTTVTTTNSSSGNGSCSGSRNTNNPRHHMLTANTNSSKGSQNQFVPITAYSTNVTTVSAYGPNQSSFTTGYPPSVMAYGPGQYMQATNNTPNSTEIDHPCPHQNYMAHNCHPVPYSDSSTSPPLATMLDPVSTSTGPQGGPLAFHLNGMSTNSYSPNQSSQVFTANPTPHGSSSTSVSSPNAMYEANQSQQQQPVYPIGVIYSA